MLLWLGFVLYSSVIVYCGSNLSKYGDIIAEKTGLSGAWIGVVLMGFVTSLPEVVTGISSVTYAGVPDIAVGNVLGACVFNMLTLAFLDAIYRPMPISAKVHRDHVISAAFGISALSAIAMTVIAIIGLTYRAEKRQLFLAWDSIGIVLVYVLNMLLLYLMK